MKKTYYFLLIAFCGLSTGFAQSDSLYSEKTSLKTLPSLKQFFNRNDFRTKPADMLENIMPDYDLTSKPLPAQPLF